MDCCLTGSSVHGILQVRILEWVAISFSNKWIKLLSIGEKNPQHCKSLIFPNSNDTIKKKKERKIHGNADSRPLRHGDLGWCYIPGTWADLGPKVGVSDLRGLGRCARRWALYRRTWRISSSGSGGGCPPAAKPSLLPPKDIETSGMEELWKVPCAPRLLVVGIPTPASFFEVTPPMDDIILRRVELRELACVREIKVKGEEIKRHNTSYTVRQNWQSQSKALVA